MRNALAGARCRRVALGAWLCLGLTVGSTRLAALNPAREADGYLIQSWFSEDGLPSSRLRAVWQARDGYLWLASSLGLARFDGARFAIYSPNTRRDLTTSNFYEILETPDGTLWFGSNGGLYSLRNDRFECLTTKEGMASNFVRALIRLRNGTIVAGTNAGVSLVRDGRVVPLEGPWKKITGVVRSILERADGSVLFASTTGLWRIVGDRAEKLSGTPSLPNTTYWCLLEQADGRLWVGTNQGLYCLHPDGQVQLFGTAQGLTSTVLQCLHLDHDGNLWIGTTGGLFRLRDGKIEQALYPDAFGASTVAMVRESQEGALLIASNSGLFQLRDTPIRAISHSDGLDQVQVTTVCEARDGAYWIGLWSGGVYRFEDGRATREPTLEKIRVNVYYSFWEEPDGTMWIGADNALLRRTKGKVENFYLGKDADAWLRKLTAQPDLVLPGIAHERVNAVISDGEGGLWVAALGALYHARDGRFTVLPRTLGQNIKSVMRTRDGDVWASTVDGVIRLHAGAWIEYRSADGHLPSFGRNFYEDSTGAIWVTLNGSNGVSRFTGGQWHNYTTRQGLADNNATSIIEDDTGFLWIGTARGIMRLARQDFDALDAGRLAELSPQVFTRKEGMPDSECGEAGTPSVWKTRDGHLLFTTYRGVAVIDPREVPFNRLPPQVFVEQFLVNGTRVEGAQAQSVSPAHTNLQFNFTATSLLSPVQVRFKVKLTPFDRDWIDTGTRRDIRYPRLPPGDYEFHVIACNNSGVWNQEGANVKLTVRPFFYQTYWFYAVVLAVAGSAIVGGYRWRVRRLRQRALELQRQNVELERRIAERTAELAKSYEALRSSEYFYHSLVESLPQIIVRKAADGRFTYANSAYGELLDRPLDQIIGRTDHDLYPKEQAEKFRADDQRMMQTGETLEYENVVEKPGRKKRFLHVKKVPLYNAQRQPMGVQVLFWDMTVFRETEELLRQAQKELIETSRLAGIAEVATGVLHNIGNALNSVNTSAALAAERVRKMKVPSVGRAAQLLLDQGERLGEFFATDPRGKQLPGFLAQLAEHLQGERTEVAQELDSLNASVEHIKQIVAAQQSFARVSGITEVVPPAELLEYALRISEASLSRHGVTVTREFLPVPTVKVQRQKVLQILVNLIRNAKESMNEGGHPTKRLAFGVRLSPEGQVQISITDNGVGIAAENLTRIFAFGFTTKKQGHGFGLHSSALAAKEMGGSLVAQSEGVGHGATFTLELPAHTENKAAG
jgi:PAS domain S-box-containing protein